MELPQPRPHRSSEGRKPTHDFLSLYGHSSTHQDPRTPDNSQDHAGGGHLKTHDFLQPLERVSNATTKEGTNDNDFEKPLLPPQASASPTAEEHILPGGIGTYSISHISTYDSFHQRLAAKTEGSMFGVPGSGASSSDRNEENSNCSSYNAGSGFTLWEEPAAKKGKTGKENVLESATTKMGKWATSERQSQSSSNNNRNTFSSLASSHPSMHKSQNFLDIIKSAKVSNQDDGFDDEEDFILKKETPSPILKGEMRVKVDGTSSSDQKPNTPRSKHSATEQRRRSKINDRFQMLREIIPHSDQKRDKASFLLEVIEYIQFLQVKVQNYEGSYQRRNNEPQKSAALMSNNRCSESYRDQSRGASSGMGPPLLFAPKLEERDIAIPGTAQKPAESDMSSATTFKPMPFPMSLEPNLFSHSAVARFPPRLESDTDNMTSLPQPNSCFTKSRGNDGAIASENKEQNVSIEGGTISISSLYSKGLLDTLTQALQSSGVDLSQANISVQIELGNRAINTPNVKEKVLVSANQGQHV